MENVITLLSPAPCFIFWPLHTACGILVPQPGIKSTPPALEAWSSFNHGTSRKSTPSPTYFLKIHTKKRKSCQNISEKHSLWLCLRVGRQRTFYATCFYDVFIEGSLVQSGIIEYLKRGMARGSWGPWYLEKPGGLTVRVLEQFIQESERLLSPGWGNFSLWSRNESSWSRKENWVMLKKSSEHCRTDAHELWCWRRLLRVPWTARRSNQSILKEIIGKMNILWKDWCWRSNTLATWCKHLTHWKRPWCRERLKAKGEEGNRV